MSIQNDVTSALTSGSYVILNGYQRYAVLDLFTMKEYEKQEYHQGKTQTAFFNCVENILENIKL